MLECRARNAAAYVRGSGGRHQRRITQVVYSLLPLLHRLWCCIHTLQSLSVDQINRISDLAAQDLNRTGPVDVEHVGVASFSSSLEYSAWPRILQR